LQPSLPQRTPPVFTQADFLSAFRLIMPDAEAFATAAEWGDTDDSRESVGVSGGDPRKGFRPESSTRLSEDMLILLSLVSPELQEKVNNHLVFFGATPRAGSTEAKLWEQRRARIEEVIARNGGDRQE
jgi:hypothetical protein